MPLAHADAPRAVPPGITFQPDIYPRVLSLLPKAPSRILDAGAGHGRFCRLAQDAGHHPEACDYSPELFQVPEVPFHRAELNDSIPLPDATFDCVVSIEVLEHLQNHARFISECVRVTRPGGTIILTTPNILSIPSRWHNFLFGYTDCAPLPLDPTRPDYYMQHINPIALHQILFHLERCGAELVTLATNRVRRGSVLPLALLYPIVSLALRAKLLRSKHAPLHPLYRRHLKWMLHPANLTGRITIALARRIP
jgi:SAM-dependent methyltransferase